jgi:hypothetical protein
MREANLISKSLSVIIIIILLATFGLTAYLPSTLKGEVNENIFTISQSLAFAIKTAFIILLTTAIGLLGYLIYYRGHAYGLFRILLIFIMYAFVLTILWVTTYYNKQDHYIFAGIIFSAASIFMILNCYAVALGLSPKAKHKLLILKIIPILVLIGFAGLIIGIIPYIDQKASPLFPTFENYMLAIQGLTILTLGFF